MVAAQRTQHTHAQLLRCHKKVRQLIRDAKRELAEKQEQELQDLFDAAISGQNGKLVLREGSEGLGVVKISGDHVKPTHGLAVTPDGGTVATVDDQFVQLYCTPDMELTASACRFTLPGRCAAYGGKGGGAVLAAGGDDGIIRLVATKENKILRQIKTDGYVRSVSVDPEGAYVAASMADGGVMVWDMSTGEQEMKRGVCPKIDTASTRRNTVAWSPDGGALLAAPSPGGDVALLERLSWKSVSYLAGTHTADVNTLAFSPNGMYLATGGVDRQVVVWLAERGVAVAKTTLEEVPSSLAWHPRGDGLLIAGEGGSVGLWARAVPPGRGLPSPWQAQDEVLRDADAAAAGASTANGTTLDDGPDDSLAGGGGGGRLNRKRGGGASAGGSLLEDPEDDDEDEGEGGLGIVRAKRARGAAAGSGGLLRPGAAAAALMAAPAPRLPKAQAAVQPGATPESAAGGGGRFLAYNSLGCVISRKVDAHRTCEVVFHDASRGRAKLPLLTDYYGFTMASLGEAGVAYASPASADAPAMLVYRPLDCWAANSDWSVQLPADEAPVCVAAGRSFVAVATSAQLLRLYSQAGRQLAALSLPGAPAALAAAGHALLVAHQGSNPCWDGAAAPGGGGGGGQRLALLWLDVARQGRVAEGALPLSRGAGLAWLGFSEEGLPAALDTAGVMRLRGQEWGGMWGPVFDSKLARAEGTSEAFWPVSVSCRELTCVVTTEAAPHPPVHPRPVLSVRPLQAPPAAAEGAPADLEDEALRLGLRAAQLRAAAADAEQDPEEAARCAEELEAALLEGDRGALRQFNAALNARRESRALELVGQLHNTRSIQGALQLANARRQAALAERISAFLEERMAWEAEQDAAAAGGGGGGGGYEQPGAAWGGGSAAAMEEGDDEEGGEEEEAPAAAPGRDDAGAKEARPPAGDQLRQPPRAGGGKPVAGIFARAGSAGSKGSAGGSGGSGGAARKPQPPGGGALAAPKAAAGGGGGNPFARAKKPKA
ncbi:MAG: hypothetical protein J3K34DRAFT_526538 [Monoraphidium minutum]|nr:MAG: hypothetical protein J3K34DRAFT_526538 [Monoraphidium minutum]